MQFFKCITGQLPNILPEYFKNYKIECYITDLNHNATGQHFTLDIEGEIVHYIALDKKCLKWYANTKIGRRYAPYRIVETFSHELAHITHPEHNRDHHKKTLELENILFDKLNLVYGG